MANATGREESATPVEFAVIVLAVMLFGVLSVMTYRRFRVPINGVWLAVIQMEVWVFCWMEGSQAQGLYRWAGRVAPTQLQWEDMIYAAALAGRWMRWLNVVILIPLAAFVWQYADRGRLFRRTFNARELLARNLPLFPCIAPALRRNLLDEPMTRGPWAVALSPIQFVAAHGLLVDQQGHPVPREWLLTEHDLPNEESPLQPGVARGVEVAGEVRFNRAGARCQFAAQLGTRFTGLPELAPHRKALAAAFLAWAHGERGRAQSFLDQLSLSFREATAGSGEGFQLDTAGVEDLLRQYPVAASLERHLRPHSSYTLTWMMALLECARSKGGQLPSCEFLWLRPVDRTLWYVLNQLGGRTPWTEAAGVWAHYEAESVLALALEDPEVEAAVDALQASLVANGWLASGPIADMDLEAGPPFASEAAGR